MFGLNMFGGGGFGGGYGGGGMMPSFGMGGGYFGNMYQQPQMMSMGYQPFMGNPYAQQRQMMQQRPQTQQRMMYSPFGMGGGRGPMNYAGGFGRSIQSPQDFGESQQQADPMQQRFAEMQKQLAATKERVLPQTYTPPQPPTSSRGMGRPTPMQQPSSREEMFQMARTNPQYAQNMDLNRMFGNKEAGNIRANLGIGRPAMPAMGFLSQRFGAF